MSKNLDNYRQLKPAEIIRAGDLYDNKSGVSNPTPVKHSIGKTPNDGYSYYTFWRRRHTKKQSTTLTPPTAAQLSAQPPVKDGKPVLVVSFYYHGTRRTVHVIKFDNRYLKGLEITQTGRRENYKPRYQFKSFLRDGIQDHITIESYGPAQ